MIGNENILIICRDLKSAHTLAHFKPRPQARYILASDDPRMREITKDFPWVSGTCWIERMESFYHVAEDVIGLTEIVNGWLKSLADSKLGLGKELFFFTRCVEGGMTSQRIQDALLLIRSYYFLFDKYKINSVLLISQPGMGWEDDVLVEAARARKIDVNIVLRNSPGALIQRALATIKVYARAGYYAANVLRIGLVSRFKHKKLKAADNEIIFQLCSSSYKHVENAIPLMKALKLKGYDALALCWHSAEKYTRHTGADQIREQGLKAHELESRCSFFDVWRGITGALRTWKKAKAKSQGFLSLQGLHYQSVPLGRILWPSIRFFTIVDIFQSYVLYKALKEFFKCHAPLAIKFWGAAALREGYLARISLSPKNRPLVFFYALGAIYNGPYDEIESHIDLMFVAGEIQKKIAIKANNVPADHIQVCGQSRYEGIQGFKNLHDRATSRGFLGIPDGYSMHVLFDSQYIIRGFISVAEQAMTLNALLNFAAKYPSAALLVKPHPCHHRGLVEELIHRNNHLKNVFLIDQGMLPYHALNAADILITKFSTIGIEAMIFNCPVISCAFDGEARFKIFEDAADYIYNLGDLEELLNKLMTDQGFKQRWQKEHHYKQKTFLAEYLCESHLSPSACQAEVLDRRLKAKG